MILTGFKLNRMFSKKIIILSVLVAILLEVSAQDVNLDSLLDVEMNKKVKKSETHSLPKQL